MTDNKRIVKNTLLLYIRMLLMLLVNLYTSRVVLDVLGVADYGIYNLVGGVVVLFSFLNNAISSATQRFFNVALGKKNVEVFQQTFNISLTIHIYIAVLVLMLSEIIGSFLINSYLNIPEDRLTAANITFQFSILTFAVQIIRVPYNCCVVAHERMAFYAYNSLWEVFLKLGMVFLLMFLPFSKLELYAFLMFLVSFFNYLAYRFYCLHCKLIQKYEFVRNSSSFKEILGFISWNMLSSTSITIQKQIINIAINAYCGVIANAAVGLATQLSAGVSTFVSNFQLAFNPRLMKLYASRQFEELKKMLQWTTKLSVLLLLLFSIPILLNLNYVIHVWLKQIPTYLVVFSLLSIMESIVAAISTPLTIVIHAVGKIKYYSIILSIITLANVPIAYLMLHLGLHPAWVFAFQTFNQMIICVFRFLYLNKYLFISKTQYMRNVIFPTVWVSLLGIIVCYSISQISFTYQYANIVLEIIAMGILIVLFGFTKNERASVYNLVKLNRIFRRNA